MAPKGSNGTSAADAGRGSNVDVPPPNVEGVEKDVSSRDVRQANVAGPSNVIGIGAYPSAAVPPVGSVSNVTTNDPPARNMSRNVARRLADDDYDWTLEDRPQERRFTVTEVDHTTSVGSTGLDVQERGRDRERDRVMAALVGKPGPIVVVNVDTVTHPWSSYSRSGFRVSNFFQVSDPKTTDMRMLSAVMSGGDNSY